MNENVNLANTTPSASVYGIQPEVDLANRLLEAGILSDTNYNAAIKELMEQATAKHDRPLSLLHVLSTAGNMEFEGLLLDLAKRTGTPLAPLTSYELEEKLCALLPIDFAVHRGAIPFGWLGRRLLVAVLNPCNPALRQDVQAVTGRECLFYIASPADYDAALMRSRHKYAVDSE